MDSTTSNREMRDQVLQLLLSGQKSQRSTARTARTSLPISREPRVPFEAWTPGAHLGNVVSSSEAADGVLSPPPVSNIRNKNASNGNNAAGAAGAGDIGILSPITPETRSRGNGANVNGNFSGPSYARLPMDADLRLAEITAGLVAATDKERRQTETIRRLAIQLERAENQVRILQKNNNTNERNGSPAESTPSPTSRRKSRSRRRNDGKYEGNENEDALYELEELRRQRREWRHKDKTSKKEAKAAANLLSEISRSAERVLAERDGHLRVIASLQQQLHERINGASGQMKLIGNSTFDDEGNDVASIEPENSQDTNSIDFPSRRRTHNIGIPPRPALSQTSQTTHSHSGRSKSYLERNHLPAENDKSKSPRKQAKDTQLEHQGDSYSPRKGRVQRLRSPGSTQSELIVRPQEKNISRSGSLPHLPACSPEDVNESDGNNRDKEDEEEEEEMNTEGQTESGGGNQTQLYQDLHELLAENKALKASLESRPVVAIPEELEELDDELGALESVVEAMELSLSTDEAKEMQLTMSTLGLGFTHDAYKMANNNNKNKSLVERVKNVKELIASKYGKYLADFGPSSDDNTLTLPPGVTLDSLQEQTEISLSKTVAPQGDEIGEYGNGNRQRLENADDINNNRDISVDVGTTAMGEAGVQETSPQREAEDDVQQ